MSEGPPPEPTPPAPSPEEPPAQPASAGGRWAWLERGLGLRELLALANPPLPGGPGWSQATGGVLLAALALQVATGVCLAHFYAASTSSAWGSVWFVEHRVLGGGLLRGLHAYGASAVVVCLGVHVARLGLAAAYRAPRELTWLLGLALVPVVLGFALTGYLLPWDQRGYWATHVATGIAASTPLLGDLVAQILRGGPELGTLTLSRFYALHTLVLPASLGAVLLLGLRARTRLPRAASDLAYWPRQGRRTLAVCAGLVALVFTLAALRAVGLEAPADPSVVYSPRPEWYFAPLRQLLKYVPEPWGSVVLPGAIALAWCALPWLDPAARPRRRLARGIVLAPLAGYLVLGAWAARADLYDEAYQEARASADADAELALRLAEDGIPAAGAHLLVSRYPPRWGARLFALHCQRCHAVDGRGGHDGPDLTGYLGRAWLYGVIKDPNDPRFFGHTKIRGMDPLPPDQHDALPGLVELLRAQAELGATNPELVAQGEEAFYELECNACHGLEDPEEAILGPNLHGYGSAAWLEAFLRDPGGELFYGEDNAMPASEDLSDAELEALVTYLRGLAPQ
ncbi:MAG: cytochrome b N-terminal domain-containing protein [Planctomycetes bacterium]|nr:cytochrome b N-terminal domain-containing protein [Planctomycetota bacterium]